MTGREPPPDRLGNYRVLRRLGEGGMGVVYLAADPQGHNVAVKALRHGVAAEPNARQRLAREVETMRRVHSPFVAEVIDADVSSEPPYIVTRYVNGRTLEDLVAQSGPMAGEALARVAYGLAAALTAVHAAGVVHRDLKPGNVMLAEGRPVVIDFGIAQAPDLTRLTMTGMFMGTPGYLAPEIIEGKASSVACDVHSWGATVAFAATGRPPFGIGSFETIFYRIINGQPDLDRIPPLLAPLVMHALARDPARRPSAAELTARLAALDPASLVPGPASAVLAGGIGRAAPGTISDRAAAGWPGGGAAGAAAGAGAAGLAGGALAHGGVAGSALNGAAKRAGRKGPAGAMGTRPFRAGGTARPVAGDYNDILPAVQYGQGGVIARPAGGAHSGGAGPGGAGPAGAYPAVVSPGAVSPGAVSPGANGAAQQSRASGRAGPLLAVAAIAVLASVSILLPVAGTAASLVAVLLLRAVTLASRAVAARRAARGARPSDTVVAAVFFPATLIRALLGMVLLAPVAVLAGGIVTGLAILSNPGHLVAQAVAFGAGAVVLSYGVGPGSASTRQPLSRFFNALGRTPVTSILVSVAVIAVTLGVVAAALSHPAYYWPLGNVTVYRPHLLHVPGLLHSARGSLIRLAGKRA